MPDGKVNITFLLLLIGFPTFCQNSKDTLIIFNLSKGNNAYLGIENPFEFNYKKSNKTLIFTSDYGKIISQGDKFLFYPDTTGTLKIMVYEADTLLYEQKVVSRQIPDPTIGIKGKELKGKIDKKSLETAEILEGFIEVDLYILEKAFHVTSFSLKIIANGKEKVFRSKSNVFTKKMKEAFKKLNSGDQIIFEDVMEFGPDGTTRYIGHEVKIEIINNG